MRQPDRIRSYFADQKAVLALVAVSGLIYNVGLAVGPWFEGQLVQCLADIIAGASAFRSMVLLAVAYAAAMVLVQAMRAVKRFYVRRFANNVNRSMKEVLYANLVRMPHAQMEQEDAGALMTKAVSDVDACVEGMRKFTTELFDTGVVMVSYFCLLAFYDWRLAILSCLFPPVAFALAERMKREVQRSTAAYKRSAGELNAATLDRVEGALLYRVFGCEPQRDRAYGERLADYESKAVRANIWVAAMQPLYQIIALLGMVLAVWLGARNVLGAGQVQWDLAAFTAFIACYARLAFKISKTAKLFNAVQQAQVSWTRIKPLMNAVEGQPQAPAAGDGTDTEGLDAAGDGTDTEGSAFPCADAAGADAAGADTDGSAFACADAAGTGATWAAAPGAAACGEEPAGAGGTEASPAQRIQAHRLELSHVSFAYPEGEEVLHDLSFAACSGQVLGVTGAVASGKSTLGRLFLCEHPYAGSISFDGRELADLMAPGCQGIVAYAGHDPELLGDSIRNNILLGERADLDRLLGQVCLAEELEAMADGVDTLVGSGGLRLSGGQQARVALARTLCHLRPITVLDDPFSALDAATERDVFAQLRCAARRDIVFLISHRLWLFPQLDQVVWLDDGRATVGTHEELMQSVPSYAALYRAQVEGSALTDVRVPAGGCALAEERFQLDGSAQEEGRVLAGDPVQVEGGDGHGSAFA